MRCAQVREALSARLDGVEIGVGGGAGVDAHVETCADCRRWADDAAMITRLARTTVAAPAPVDDDLLAMALAAAPGRGWATTGRGLRLGLALVGFAQFILGVAQIAALGMTHGIGPAGGMTSDHLWHESAAWNIAIGAGYAWIALRNARPSGALPMLTAFVGVLVLLSIDDLVTGEVAASALLTHGFVLLGYVILLALRHPGFDAPPGGRMWRLRADVDEVEAPMARPVSAPARGATARSKAA